MNTTNRTVDRPRVERPVSPDANRRPTIAWLAVVAAAAASIGLLVGFLAWGGDDRDPTAPVAVGGDDLTQRQQQMVDLVDDYTAAWRAGDGDAVAALFAADGVATIVGQELPVEGGVLAAYVEANPLPTLDVLEPMLVGEAGMLNYHEAAGFGTLSNVIEFTTEGELLIVSHEIPD